MRVNQCSLDHDSDFNLSRSDIYAREKTFSNSLTGNMVSGPNAGITNYYLLVYPHDQAVTTPALVLWFFDRIETTSSRKTLLAIQSGSPTGSTLAW